MRQTSLGHVLNIRPAVESFHACEVRRVEFRPQLIQHLFNQEKISLIAVERMLIVRRGQLFLEI